ncbi:Hansenula MRAKII killer toxin-resistant protein 1 [Actinoplanes sp. CA-030573]|uniref:Hansenula MRAKII killer toxin-resistant protein 1 n=1 Tax=Actinoplanes sp. CA-030573 TaxID=3239898 RepID=UPI003D932BB9
MADRGWTSRAATAAGVAAGTGAAQLGLGYGLGVIVWPVAVTQDRSEWLGSLGWATWITASATVFGAVVASRLGGESGSVRRALLAISAGVGALVAVALIALPARSAVRLDAHSPQAIAAGYALIGVVLGVLVAYWAVSSRPVAANLVATAAWLWALAITAIIVELSGNRDSATYLTSWQFAGATDGVRYGVIYWPSAVLTLAAAFLVGVIAVIPAVRRGDLGLGAATSGAVGPLLVAASFLALSPRLTDSLGPIESAYLIAPYAVLAGLAGSALTVTAGKSLAIRSPQDSESPDPDSADADSADARHPQSEPSDTRHTDEAAVAFPATPMQAPPRQPGPAPTETSPARPAPTETSSARPAPIETSSARPAPTPRPANGPKPPPTATSSTTRTPNALTDPPRAPKPITSPPKAPEPATDHPGAASPSARADAERAAGGHNTDPEIASAARSGRLRGRKATPARKAPPEAAAPPRPGDTPSPKSTVTPPPATPTIARINPQPAGDD